MSKTGTHRELLVLRVVLIVSCSNKIAIEAQHGLIAQVIKDVIFSIRPVTSPEAASSSAGEEVDTVMSIG